MLAINKVLTILCLLCLCGNREYPGKNKSVSSFFIWVPKWNEREDLFEVGKIYPLNYLLHKGVMLTIIKVFIILFIPCLWKQGANWIFSKQDLKLSVELSVQRYYLLGQTESEIKILFRGSKTWELLEDAGLLVRLSARALGCYKRWKKSPFVNLKWF